LKINIWQFFRYKLDNLILFENISIVKELRYFSRDTMWIDTSRWDWEAFQRCIKSQFDCLTTVSYGSLSYYMYMHTLGKIKGQFWKQKSVFFPKCSFYNKKYSFWLLFCCWKIHNFSPKCSHDFVLPVYVGHTFTRQCFSGSWLCNPCDTPPYVH